MPAVSKAQQRFMGMVHAVKKGEMKAPSPEVAQAAASMKKKDAKDFASTKHDKLPEKKEAKDLINSLLDIFALFVNLDLRRFSTLIVSDAFDDEIRKITTRSTLVMKNKFLLNNNTHAMVLTLIKDDTYEMVLVLKSCFALNLIRNEKNPIRYKDAIHIVHHEFAHIHDINKKIDAKKDFSSSNSVGINEIFYPIAELCWSEYIANFISSASATKSAYPLIMAQKLIKLIKNNNLEILLKESKKDLTDDVLKKISEEINTLLKTSSYLLGYLHGFKISLDELDPKLAFELENSPFIDTWDILSYEFYAIRKNYPKCFLNDNTYDSLCLAIESAYNKTGILFFEKENKKCEAKVLY